MISQWLFDTLAALSQRLSWAEPFDWDDEDELLVNATRSPSNDVVWR